MSGQFGALLHRASSICRHVSTPTASVPHAIAWEKSAPNSAKSPNPVHFRTIGPHRYTERPGVRKIATVDLTVILSCHRLTVVSDRDSFKLDELAAAAKTSPRTVRYYVQRGLLPAPAFRGKDTAYTREHRVRLRAIRQLQERYLPLDAIQAELARLSGAELERLALGEGDAGAPLTAPGRGDAGQSKSHVHIPMPPVPAPFRGHAERWTRFELAPGFEIHVSDAASSDVRELAEEIRDRILRQRGARR